MNSGTAKHFVVDGRSDGWWGSETEVLITYYIFWITRMSMINSMDNEEVVWNRPANSAVLESKSQLDYSGLRRQTVE